MNHRRPEKLLRAGIACVALVLAAGLAGCASGTAPPSAATPSEEAATPSALEAESVSGVDSTGAAPVAFAIPVGARSVIVDFTCEGGGRFTVELGDSMMLGQGVLTGVCDGTQPLAWPVTDRTGPTLSVSVPDGVEWKAQPHFSVDEFMTDPAIAAECQQYSEVVSAFFNAETGYAEYEAIDAAEWHARVDQASADLESLAASSTSELAEPLRRYNEAVNAVDLKPGSWLSLAGAQKPAESVRQVCNVNHTPVVTMAEFGG